MTDTGRTAFPVVIHTDEALRELIDCAVARQEILDEVTAQRDALLKTMKWLDRWLGGKPMPEVSDKIRAAIKAVEGETK